MGGFRFSDILVGPDEAVCNRHCCITKLGFFIFVDANTPHDARTSCPSLSPPLSRKMLGGKLSQQLNVPCTASKRNVQALACHAAPTASTSGAQQMRSSNSSGSCVRQQVPAQRVAAVPSFSRKRRQPVLAAVGNGTNGNGKPAADEGEQPHHSHTP